MTCVLLVPIHWSSSTLYYELKLLPVNNNEIKVEQASKFLESVQGELYRYRSIFHYLYGYLLKSGIKFVEEDSMETLL